ncbi:hypothetical protein PoB_006880300 [Plakobranchus ocellatus]|uniref:Uncharacterized protein n=1 Tax=Plakobranchus ocellatus TaxID=259542 RepID=A0AAV4DDK3_9GAST|nr:hypothetical protein PoB_006880300 [Plakobranchus ocellatus]
MTTETMPIRTTVSKATNPTTTFLILLLALFNFTTSSTSDSLTQQGDLRLLGPPSGQGAGSGARTRDRRIPADLRADSLTTVPPTPLRSESDRQQAASGKRQAAGVTNADEIGVHILVPMDVFTGSSSDNDESAPNKEGQMVSFLRVTACYYAGIS